MNNILTIDVEDYFHVAALANAISVDDWDSIKPRVYENTQKILTTLEKYDSTATFFVLGWVAERFPELVKEIDAMGHEVASHGYSHQLVYNQTPELFYSETSKSKEILENIIGKEVTGYRAASYSITRKSLWALDILCELGFSYDSSIFPVYHDRYGIADSPSVPHMLVSPNGSRIIEYPLSVFKLGSYNLPVAGGGYFRLYPYWLTRFFYNAINKKDLSFVFYMHPWEIDADQPRIKTNWFSEFRHYNNLDKTENRLIRLLNDFKFIGMSEYLKIEDLLSNKEALLVDYRQENLTNE